MLKHIYPLLFTLTLPIQGATGQANFTVQQLKDDLQFYKSKLEKYHPNLYLYTPKQKIDYFFDSLYQSIDQPLSEAAFYQLLTLSSNLIKDGHTLILPSNAFTGHHNSKSRFLPLEIGLYEDQLYVRKICTKTKVLDDGSKINSISGVSSDEILQKLLNRQVRDGHNLSYSKWILDNYFREFYSYTFGHPDTFKISYTNHNLSHTIQAPALVKDSIYVYKQRNYPKPHSGSKQDKGIYLNFDSTKQIAILTIKDFHSEVLKNEYHQSFNREISSTFDIIFSNGVQNLVIDIRDNQGGDVKNGVFLLSFLISKPFKVVNEYNRIKNNSLAKCSGASMGYHKPNKKQFKGQIYVLVNGGSFSNSAIVSSCLSVHTNAIFIGTETGGNPNILAGYPKEFELPNTKIRVEVPTKRFVMTSLAKNSGKGVIPTYTIEKNIQDNILQFDKALDFVLKLIHRYK